MSSTSKNVSFSSFNRQGSPSPSPSPSYSLSIGGASILVKKVDHGICANENTIFDNKKYCISDYISENNPALIPCHLSPEQLVALQKFRKGENIFITGPGGTGKSYLIKRFQEYCAENKRLITVTALTGCAAILLGNNAKTIHSWSGIRLAKGTKEAILQNVLRNKMAVKNWKAVKTLIIDEVSMLSKRLFDILDNIAKVIRKCPLPFGGIQVVFTGDFFQLPPIPDDGDMDSAKFCFESANWVATFSQDNHIELKTMFRQTDPGYISILREIRMGAISEASIETLNTYKNRDFDTTKYNGCIPTKLFPTRVKVDYYNNIMYSKIDATEHVFEAVRTSNSMIDMETGAPLKPEEINAMNKMDAEMRERELDVLSKSIPAVPLLRLKVGVAVMCIVNLDMASSICNGSQGIVIGMVYEEDCTSLGVSNADDYVTFHSQNAGKTGVSDVKKCITKERYPVPVVKFANGVVKPIPRHHWISSEGPFIAISQIPLCLAWAITIHKIQGASLQMAEMDIGKSIFEYGQTYVALSRIESLDGLYLTDFNADKIRANPKVVEFYKRYFSHS